MRSLHSHNINSRLKIYFDAKDNSCDVIIEHNDSVIAKFPIELVYDTILDELHHNENDNDNNSGLKRRVHEARNIYKLTSEYLVMVEDK